MRWRFLLHAREEQTGQEHALLDEEASYPIANVGRPWSVPYAVFLLNELIARFNALLGAEAAATPLPYLGVCRLCGAVVDDQHLLGAERDVCDRCWEAGRR